MGLLGGKLPDANSHPYEIGFPKYHNFTFSGIATRLKFVVKEFRFSVMRQGEGKVQYVIGAGINIRSQLDTVMTSTEFKCTVTPSEPPRPRDFRTFAYMKRAVLNRKSIGIALNSALLSLNTHENLAIKLDVLMFGRVRQDRESNKVILSLTVMFSGTPQRLKEIFPEVRDRKCWKFGGALTRRSFLGEMPWIDELFPSPSIDFAESELKPNRGRHYIAPPLDGAAISGLWVDRRNERQFAMDARAMNDNTAIVGMSGYGKTTLMARLVESMERNGHTVYVIDPHGDLSVRLAGLLRDRIRVEEVLYSNPLDCPVGLNPLTLAAGGGDANTGPSLVSDAIGSAIRRLFGEISWGARLKFLMSIVIQSLSEVDGWNLVDAMQIINNPLSLQTFSQQVSNPVSRDFLLNEVPKAQSDWWMSLKDKIGLIVLDDISRKILCKREDNCPLDEWLAEGRSFLLNLDMTRIGETASLMIGSIMIAMLWLRASSMRKKVTIVIDEFQNYPIEMIKQIATQGRKYGLNLIIATQSPSILDRETQAMLGTNFRNIFTMRLGKEDAAIVSKMTVGIDENEITGLEQYTALYARDSGSAVVRMEDVLVEGDALEFAIRKAKKSYPFKDDAYPSFLALHEKDMADVIQIVSTAELQAMNTISSIDKSGLLAFYGYRTEQFKSLLKMARVMGLVDSKGMGITDAGRAELLRLQGGMLAGSDKHRKMLQEVKDLFDSMGYLTRIPNPGIDGQTPDLVTRVTDTKAAHLLFVEIELGTRHDNDGRRKKIQNAKARGAIPVFVYADKNAGQLAYNDSWQEGVFLLHAADELSRYFKDEMLPISNSGDLLRKET